jgi:hypothetical protein
LAKGSSRRDLDVVRQHTEARPVANNRRHRSVSSGYTERNSRAEQSGAESREHSRAERRAEQRAKSKEEESPDVQMDIQNSEAI